MAFGRVPTGRIEGAVVGSRTGDPILGAIVTVEGTALSGETDDAGRYVIDDVPPGSYTVRAQAPGFISSIMSGVVGSASATTIDF